MFVSNNSAGLGHTLDRWVECGHYVAGVERLRLGDVAGTFSGSHETHVAVPSGIVFIILITASGMTRVPSSRYVAPAVHIISAGLQRQDPEAHTSSLPDLFRYKISAVGHDHYVEESISKGILSDGDDLLYVYLQDAA